MGLGNAIVQIPQERFVGFSISYVLAFCINQVRHIRTGFQSLNIIFLNLVQNQMQHGHTKCQVSCWLDRHPFTLTGFRGNMRVDDDQFHPAGKCICQRPATTTTKHD